MNDDGVGRGGEERRLAALAVEEVRRLGAGPIRRRRDLQWMKKLAIGFHLFTRSRSVTEMGIELARLD